ncbi:Cuticlin-1 [Temnothorax longispinosus]|uniref:Cuticlin-1 n=1 Tax=Temnothorax longispinosus TaxID=300112 RepID=A0A4S2KYK9_9HYME|nr:Cuticlin-1 [Temnothorax longispinosus]
MGSFAIGTAVAATAASLIFTALLASGDAALARTAFEKLTDYDYRGTTYYSVRNLSLYECQGWCREEAECQAAAFSFVVNPLAPMQDTLCQLQNETAATNPAAQPQRAANMYYMTKLQIRSENVCLRPWAFERIPNKMIRGLDNALIYTSTKEACLAACLNEHRFTCRSVEYNYVTLQCHLGDSDRRTTGQYVQFVDAQGVDYFENLCLKGKTVLKLNKENKNCVFNRALTGKEACKAQRIFQMPRIGVADDKVAQYAGLHYYTDKELQVQSESACRLACEIENEFLCRSFLYRGAPQGSAYNCQLFHLDHWTLPDGPSTYLNAERPLIDNGERVGTYFENFCEKGTGPISDPLPVVFETTEDSTINNLTRNDINCDKTGTCYDVSVDCKDTRIAVQVRTNKPFNGRIYALGRSETCNIDVINSDLFRLDLTMSGQDCNTQSVRDGFQTGIYSNTVVLQHHSVVMTKADKIYKVKCTYDMSSKNITFGMMPIRDPEMISITSAPEAPPPRIRILDSRSREVETVRIGDKLTFRIEIPEDTPYGIFARSCVAMAKDSKSTFQIIDDEGCPVDPSIFPSFTPDGNALQSVYEAFRFTESYGVIFQCNVKYCLGPCEPAVCEWGRESVESWGKRRRRSIANSTEEKTEDMTLSQEILVLDFGDEKQSDFLKNDASIDFNEADKTITIVEPCPTKTSVLALGVTCALLVLIYISTIFCYYMKKWLTPRKMMP